MTERPSVMEAPDLSFAAKGLWMYVLTMKARKERITIKRMQEQSRTGRTGIMTAIRELEEGGYLVKTPRVHTSGMREGYEWEIRNGGGL